MSKWIEAVLYAIFFLSIPTGIVLLIAYLPDVFIFIITVVAFCVFVKWVKSEISNYNRYVKEMKDE